MGEVNDVVVVGGGIAGASLAYALASAGLGVTVLEASNEYEDRVRGESMQAWGVKEAQNLGVDKVLLDAGARITAEWKQYVEGVGEAATFPMSMMVEGVPGTLNMRHPDACQALIDAASDAGAKVVRGARDIKLNAGRSVSIAYSNGKSEEVTARLVVGADGRNSAVRRQTGIELGRDDATCFIAGLLISGLRDIPEHDFVVSEGDQFMLLFQQEGGRGRLYICVGRSAQHRFAGHDGAAKFMESWNAECFPWTRNIKAATPVGPCATYPGDDTWSEAPYADGVVLIGDAAGYNDPVIGQGLSIALRDARVVRDLILDGARRPSDFLPYGQERVERMRRLRLIADVMSATEAEDAGNRAARRMFVGGKMAAMDPEVFPLVVGAFTGPENVPDDLVDEVILERIRGA